jgi:LPXTG-motif cell wall-anchored protein
LDPEPGEDFAEFLGPFGLKLYPVLLANDKSYVRITYTPADRHFIYSNRFSSHPSVSTLTRNSNRLATVLLGAGYLEEVPSTGGDKPQVQFTIHSMPGTWNDVNNNLVFDAGTEKRKEYELAAVVTQKVKGKDRVKGKSKDDEARLLVVADSDCISDKVFRNAGNGYLLIDALKWMGGEEEVMGETTSEEDVRMVHTRKKDQIWFYLTIFGVPALVLAGGLVYTRRRRRRS